MSNNTLTEPIGIDVEIQGVQKNLYANLVGLWSGDISAYGRIYKNQSDKGLIPEWYNSSKKDYEEVYYDDKKSCVFCFLVGDNDTTEDELLFITNVKIVFMLDLSKVYPSETERQDAKVQRDVVNFLRDYNFQRYKITDIERGIDTIFNDYETSGIKFNDIQPFHSFSVNLTLSYELTEKCN